MDVPQEIKIDLCEEQYAFAVDPWKYGGFFGEYGNGKTLAAIILANRLSKISKNVGMVLRKTWGDNRDTTLKQFHDFLPSWEQYYRSSEHVHKLPNGSTIYWRGMDRVGRVLQLNNYNLGWFWIEQMEEMWSAEVWNTLEGRLKLTNIELKGFGTANPAGHNWCWQKFISPQSNSIYRYFQPLPRWNKANLPENYYEEKEKNWPPQMVARFLNGKHEGYEGLLYSNFNRRVHIHSYSKDNLQQVQTELCRPGTYWEFQDYGLSDANAMVWLWGWMGSDGILRIIDEFYKKGCKPDEAGQAVKATRAKWGIEGLIKKTIACPRAFQHEKDGTTPADYFKSEYGIILSQNPVQFEVRYPLAYQKLDDEKIEISENCPNLIAEMESLTWENLKSADDHAVEAFERGVARVFKPVGDITMRKTVDIERHRKRSESFETAGLMQEDF